MNDFDSIINSLDPTSDVFELGLIAFASPAFAEMFVQQLTEQAPAQSEPAAAATSIRRAA